MVDFSGIVGDAWITKAAPDHHNLWERWERFLRWCAACAEEEIVAVSHQQLMRANLSVMLENCDILGVTLDRKTLAVEPYMYQQPRLYTLRWTAVKCDADGMRL